jgi:hypothetical protein
MRDNVSFSSAGSSFMVDEDVVEDSSYENATAHHNSLAEDDA